VKLLRGDTRSHDLAFQRESRDAVAHALFVFAFHILKPTENYWERRQVPLTVPSNMRRAQVHIMVRAKQHLFGFVPDHTEIL
jgi:hypothetical protein